MLHLFSRRTHPTGHPSRLRGAVLRVLTIALVASTLALGWSAGYDPYSADIALPAAQDILLVAFFVMGADQDKRVVCSKIAFFFHILQMDRW